MAASGAESAAWPGRLSGAGTTVSVMVATAIVVADMVGVGVFTSLGFQVQGHPLGLFHSAVMDGRGVVALCGVFSYSEPARCFRARAANTISDPRLSSSFRFLAGWVSATVGFAAPVALAAMAFGEYGKAVLRARRRLCLHRCGLAGVDCSAWRRQALRHLSIDLDHFEVVLIVAFLIAGFVIGTPQPVSFTPSVSDFAHITSAPFRHRARVRDVFVFGVERRDLHHRRDAHAAAKPARALLAGTLIVLVLYVALNAVFLHTTPIDNCPAA